MEKHDCHSQEAFGDGQQKEMPISQRIDNYNHRIGGIDRADQLRGYHGTQLTSFCARQPILFLALDSNAHNVCSNIDGIPDMNHKAFLLQQSGALFFAHADANPSVEISQNQRTVYVAASITLPKGRCRLTEQFAGCVAGNSLGISGPF